MRLLLVEDETGIVDFVSRALRAHGYVVEIAADGPTGLAAATSRPFDLVVLDRGLPGLDGLEVLRTLRAAKRALPVIVLTARSEVADRVEGLDAGATDYLTKPFSVDELLARVRAHLRTPAQAQPSRLAAAGIELDLLARTAERNGVTVQLSAKEFDLLAHFLRHPNQALSREQLLDAVWGYDFEPQTNVVEVYVGYLRRKLAATGSPAPIDTVRSVGYRLTSR